jgi:hypothetical protein
MTLVMKKLIKTLFLHYDTYYEDIRENDIQSKY